jgi:hypothetical protein
MRNLLQQRLRSPLLTCSEDICHCEEANPTWQSSIYEFRYLENGKRSVCFINSVEGTRRATDAEISRRRPRPCGHGRVTITGQNLFQAPEHHAFTLLEAVASVAIFCLLMVGVAALWHVCWSATEKINNSASQNLPELVLKRVGDAIEASVFHKKPKSLYSWNAENTRGGSSESDQVSFVTSFAPDATEGSPEYAPLERVLIRARDNDRGTQELVMFAAPFTMEKDDWQRETVLLQDVAAFRVRYRAAKNKEWLDRWSDENHAPSGVEFSIALKGEEAKRVDESWSHACTVKVNPTIELSVFSSGKSTNSVQKGTSAGAAGGQNPGIDFQNSLQGGFQGGQGQTQ